MCLVLGKRGQGFGYLGTRRRKSHKENAVGNLSIPKHDRPLLSLPSIYIYIYEFIDFGSWPIAREPHHFYMHSNEITMLCFYALLNSHASILGASERHLSDHVLERTSGCPSYASFINLYGRSAARLIADDRMFSPMLWNQPKSACVRACVVIRRIPLDCYVDPCEEFKGQCRTGVEISGKPGALDERMLTVLADEREVERRVR